MYFWSPAKSQGLNIPVISLLMMADPRPSPGPVENVQRLLAPANSSFEKLVTETTWLSSVNSEDCFRPPTGTSRRRDRPRTRGEVTLNANGCRHAARVLSVKLAHGKPQAERRTGFKPGTCLAHHGCPSADRHTFPMTPVRHWSRRDLGK